MYTNLYSSRVTDHLLDLMSFTFFFTDTATTEIYTLSLHDALPISPATVPIKRRSATSGSVLRTSATTLSASRSEEHTSELQSRVDLVCRLLLEKKKKTADIENSKQCLGEGTLESN